MSRSATLMLVALGLVGCRQLLGIEDDPDVVVAIDSAPPIDQTDAAADGPADTVSTACVPETCIAAGGGCSGDTCEIKSISNDVVTCPPDMPCRVLCETSNACAQGVRCGGATKCEVSCSGTDACGNGGVDCGQADTCNVECTGVMSCESGGPGAVPSVHCQNATCDVSCQGEESCSAGVDANDSATCRVRCCGAACNASFGNCTVEQTCTQ